MSCVYLICLLATANDFYSRYRSNKIYMLEVNRRLSQEMFEKDKWIFILVDP